MDQNPSSANARSDPMTLSKPEDAPLKNSQEPVAGLNSGRKQGRKVRNPQENNPADPNSVSTVSFSNMNAVPRPQGSAQISNLRPDANRPPKMEASNGGNSRDSTGSSPPNSHDFQIGIWDNKDAIPSFETWCRNRRKESRK